MELGKILEGITTLSVEGDIRTEVTAICSDSRKVVPGALFVAVRGFSSDGHDFIAQAIGKGAAAVLYEDGSKTEGLSAGETVLVRVGNSRRAEAVAAANFYDNPSRKLTLVGITGTNGKTTTVTLLYNLFTGLGYSCGLLSTIANYVGDERSDTVNTTSDPITINSLLAKMAGKGCEYCFMEVSSIGLHQDRVAGLDFKAGIFSNLTHDHLDYHKTFAEYLRCKKLFFDNLGPDAFAIVNTDDRNGTVMVQNTAARVVTYSCKGIADHTCRIIEKSFDGMQLRLDGHEVWTRLIGAHNASNILASYTTAVCLGADPEEVLTVISALGPAKGRLENIKGPRDLTVVIDYAHTPDALDNVLRTLRETSASRSLICVFGCGGDRDKTKRPEMAAVAQKYADRIVVTSDNSRSERTEDILEDIRAGFSKEGLAKSVFIADRREAIRTAISFAPDGAAILLAGKGHETYQIIGNTKYDFDERVVVKETFEAIK